ncbi:hypothetical protein NFHSH190041_28280 [Shewanella sp. NFH-SH190041]|uniref:hypothetical protein n=1 Tax=Shewanella sp. NFH-SH190041 TaxID=2950245 RepID=UPI0021C26814|nr:hypothetical protein [Shewanella sp. NFH-SH190041]BDM65376.1 hypothetical protein NFHSH190041_28280 [Shewanella sp. NFH-SH190041]
MNIYRQGFICNFLDFAMERYPKPNYYEDYFLNYTPSKWKDGSGDGLFKYYDNNGIEYSLIIIEDLRYGILLTYSKFNENNQTSISSYYSVGNKLKINNMTLVDDELFMPSGCFMKPKIAWLAVKAFLTAPTVMPNSIEWVNEDDIPWLEY